MPDPIWYFADGDEERGPVTEAQIRVLIGTGNLKAEDLVWREGMDDWQPAREIPGLFRTAAEAAVARPKPEKRAALPEPPEPRRTVPPAVALPIARWKPRQPLEIFKYLAFLGQPLLLAALLMVVGSRGCESMAGRYAERLASRAAVAQARFEAQTRRQHMQLEQQRTELLDRPILTPAERSRLERLNDELRELSAQRQAEFQRLQAGAWQELDNEAREARAVSTMSNFWRSGIFWIGTLLLSVSLAIIGFTGRGAEAWMCLAMLAVLLLSLYVGRPF